MPLKKSKQLLDLFEYDDFSEDSSTVSSECEAIVLPYPTRTRRVKKSLQENGTRTRNTKCGELEKSVGDLQAPKKRKQTQNTVRVGVGPVLRKRATATNTRPPFRQRTNISASNKKSSIVQSRTEEQTLSTNLQPKSNRQLRNKNTRSSLRLRKKQTGQLSVNRLDKQQPTGSRLNENDLVYSNPSDSDDCDLQFANPKATSTPSVRKDRRRTYSPKQRFSSSLRKKRVTSPIRKCSDQSSDEFLYRPENYFSENLKTSEQKNVSKLWNLKTEETDKVRRKRPQRKATKYTNEWIAKINAEFSDIESHELCIENE